MAYASDLKSDDRNIIWVRLPSPANLDKRKILVYQTNLIKPKRWRKPIQSLKCILVKCEIIVDPKIKEGNRAWWFLNH